MSATMRCLAAISSMSSRSTSDRRSRSSSSVIRVLRLRSGGLYPRTGAGARSRRKNVSDTLFSPQPDEEEGMSDHLELVSEARCFEGFQRTYRHESEACRCTMQFAVYLPPAAERGPVPAVYWLSGLTCTEENFSTKSGAQRYAAELGLAL